MSYFSFFEGEKYKDDNHTWDDEVVGTEYSEAQSRDNQPGNAAGMVFLPKPVVGEDSRKHGGQHEIQSFEIEVEKRTDEAAQRSPDNPIGFIEPGNPEQVPPLVGSFRNLGSASQGKGLVRHAEDEKELLPSQSLVFFEHRESIKQVSCIHHQYHQKGLQRMETAQQHVAQQELCAAGINRDGEQHRVQKVEAQLMHVNAISQSQKSISCHDRQGSMESVI